LELIKNYILTLARKKMKSKFLSLIFIVIPVVFISCKKDISNLQFEEVPQSYLLKIPLFQVEYLALKANKI
jgi:hypothetical protein